MSDIVIKNGKLPPNCWDCKYESYHVPDCPCWNGTADASDYRQSRYPFCPIKELPEHGELVEKTAITEKMIILENKKGEKFFAIKVEDYNNLPVILEASK